MGESRDGRVHALDEVAEMDLDALLPEDEIAALARRAGIDMPITAAVCQVLDGTLSPSAAVSRLMERDPKAEFQLPERAQPHR
jgi:glycerol-3-phosphate dehydrogenase